PGRRGDPDRLRRGGIRRRPPAAGGQGPPGDRAGARRVGTPRRASGRGRTRREGPFVNARDTLSPTAARDAYLAWQAEIGGDDVVLAAPWVRRAPAIPGSAGSARLSGSPRPGDTAASPTPERPALPEVRFQPMEPFVVPVLTDVPGYIPGAAAGPELFNETAQRLAGDEQTSARTGGPAPRNPSPAAATPMTASASPLQETLAGLKDLEAYWSYLATAYPGWFSGARVIAAEGHAAPRLAV